MKLLLVWELGLLSKWMEISKLIMKLKLDLIEKLGKNISKTLIYQIIVGLTRGPVEYLFKPENTAQLLEFLKHNKN